jgi:beta-lactamase class A
VPEGTEVPVVEVATGMIAISDNTATDHLIERLGRENIEQNLSRVGHGAPELNIPFLSTRELFLLKLAVADADVETYLASDVAARRAFLSGLAGQLPELSSAGSWNEPRRIDQIEWFASASELCTVMATLDTLADQPALEPLHTVLSNNPGAPLDPAVFPYVAHKGGSEPGVLNLTWLVHDAAGVRYFVSIGLNDESDPLTDTTPALVTALGIFDLLAAGE